MNGNLRERILAELDERKQRTQDMPDKYLDWAEAKARSLRTWAALRRIAVRHVIRGDSRYEHEDYPYRCVQCAKAYRDPWCDDLADVADLLGLTVEATP